MREGIKRIERWQQPQSLERRNAFLGIYSLEEITISSSLHQLISLQPVLKLKGRRNSDDQEGIRGRENDTLSSSQQQELGSRTTWTGSICHSSLCLERQSVAYLDSGYSFATKRYSEKRETYSLVRWEKGSHLIWFAFFLDIECFQSLLFPSFLFWFSSHIILIVFRLQKVNRTDTIITRVRY